MNPCVEPGSADNESEVPSGKRGRFSKPRYEAHNTRTA